MRVAVGIRSKDIERVIETPPLSVTSLMPHHPFQCRNAKSSTQLSLPCLYKDDSIERIYDTLKQCAMIGKTAGGIGLNIHCIGLLGMSTGNFHVITFSDLLFACQISHSGHQRIFETNVLVPSQSTSNRDMPAFSNLRKDRGTEEVRGRDLFYALSISDLL